ncbi:hypothetical protein Tco_1539539 [Tanacetum coccineum]
MPDAMIGVNLKFDIAKHIDSLSSISCGWEKNLRDKELKLLKMTKVRTVALDPPATAVLRGSNDSIDRLFDEGDNARQEHSAERDDVQEETLPKMLQKLLLRSPKRNERERRNPSLDIRETEVSSVPSSSTTSIKLLFHLLIFPLVPPQVLACLGGQSS